MGRRPLLGYSAGLRRRDNRMAPGGKMYSESPMTARRTGMAVGVPPPPVVPPTWIDYQYWPPADFNNGEVGIDVSYWFQADNTSPNYGWVGAGDTCVMVACMNGHALTAPAGWTTLVSGNVGDFWYWAGVQENVVIDATVVIGTSGGVVTAESMVYLLGFTNVPAGYHVTATAAAEDTSSSTHTLAQPDPGWVLPFTNTLLHGGGGTTKYVFMEYMDGTWDQFVYGVSNGLPTYGYSYQTFTNPGQALPNPLTLETRDWATATTPFATDSVSFALGWA